MRLCYGGRSEPRQIPEKNLEPAGMHLTLSIAYLTGFAWAEEEKVLKILVAGAYDGDEAKVKQIEAFCMALGAAIIGHKHVLLNGCRSTLDEVIARAAYNALGQNGETDPEGRVISYVLAGRAPIHNYGTVLKSMLATWDLAEESFYVPEQIREADVVILVGGHHGTLRAANWARIAKKPLLPVAVFGGAAERVFEQELHDFEEKYGGRIDEMEYQQLNSITTDWNRLAEKIVSLAERIAISKSVVAIMSYSHRGELVDAYESFRTVCSEPAFGYQCERVEDSNTVGRIVPRIFEQIERAAFVVADLTELKSNVFYELGYAQGLGKPVLLTAKSGTELPFDVKDIPTIFWDSQTRLKEDLRGKIRLIAEKQGR